jgi:hypothetical protein
LFRAVANATLWRVEGVEPDDDDESWLGRDEEL